jgi:hypothetical protein
MIMNRELRRQVRRSWPHWDSLEGRTLLAAPHNPAFDVIHLYDARNDPAFAGIDGTGIGIADLDTGVAAQNPDLSGNIKGYYDALNPSNTTPIDPEGHGSHTSGIEASTDPNIGVAYHANLYDVRVIPGENEPTSSNDPIADGLQWVLDHHTEENILVVNMSLGTINHNDDQPYPTTNGEARLVAELEANGVTVVSSSGNSYGDYQALGAAFPALNSTLSVGSVWDDSGTDDGQSAPLSPQDPLILGGPINGDQYATVETAAQADQISAFSQRSNLPNMVFAPGEVIYSTYNGTGDNAHAYMQGTSMAAPMVSGVVALIQQAAEKFGGRDLTPDEVQKVVVSTADTIQDPTISTNLRTIPQFGANGQIIGFSTPQVIQTTGQSFKRVNVENALRAVQQMFAAGNNGGGTTGSPDLNDTLATAIPEPALNGAEYFTDHGTIGTDGTTNVGPNDVDLYQIPILTLGQIDLGIRPSGSLIPYVRLFDSSGRDVALTGQVQNGNLLVQSSILPAGTYYFGVSSQGNSSYNPNNGSGVGGGSTTGDYQIAVIFDNHDPNGVIPGAVPYKVLPIVAQGDIGSDPPPIDADGKSDTTLSRVTVGTDDVDMFQVIAPDTGTLNISTVGTEAQFGRQACDTYIRVFDPNGNQLAANDDVNGTTDNFVQVHVTSGETVYVAVSDTLNRLYNAFNP